MREHCTDTDLINKPTSVYMVNWFGISCFSFHFSLECLLPIKWMNNDWFRAEVLKIRSSIYWRMSEKCKLSVKTKLWCLILLWKWCDNVCPLVVGDFFVSQQSIPETLLNIIGMCHWLCRNNLTLVNAEETFLLQQLLGQNSTSLRRSAFALKLTSQWSVDKGAIQMWAAECYSIKVCDI